MGTNSASGAESPRVYTLSELRAGEGHGGLRLHLSPEALFSARIAAGALAQIQVGGSSTSYVAEVWPLAKLKRRDAALSPAQIGGFAVGADIKLVRTITEPPSAVCTSIVVELVSIGAVVERSTAAVRGHAPKAGTRRSPAVLSPAMRQHAPAARSSATETTEKRAPHDTLIGKISTALVDAIAEGENRQTQALFERRIMKQLNGWRPVAGNQFTATVLATCMTLRVVQASSVCSSGDGVSKFGPVTSSTLMVLRTSHADDAMETPMDGQLLQQATLAVQELGPVAIAAVERSLETDISMERIVFQDIGGYTAEINALRDLIILPLSNPRLFSEIGLQPPRGVLLHGPPGTGKTLLARAVASEAGCALFIVSGAEMLSEFLGESEVAIEGVFMAARSVEPAVIFLDEFDAIAAGRTVASSLSAQSSSSARLIQALAEQIDALSGHQVVVIAGTNRVETLDESLRRPGRFDREIEVGVPTPSDRRAILKSKLRLIRHGLSDDEVCAIADRAHGFVGADLASLCGEAALNALRRLVENASDGLNSMVSMADFQAACAVVRPSALREVALEIPDVRWSDIGGLEDVKTRLREVVELPFQREADLKHLSVRAPQGVLLYGPPGCSKTMLARAVANEAKLNFLSVKGSELYSKYVGESEKGVQRVFQRARLASPCVIFLDEIDGLASSRSSDSRGGVSVGERVVSQLLQEMDGLEQRRGVIVIGATNRLDAVDSALLRPGRFDRLVHVPLPDLDTRRAILEVHCRRLPLGPDVAPSQLAATTEGYTGADISNLCREAGLCAMVECLDSETICLRHFNQAMETL